MGVAVKYLSEHVDEILAALRHSKDVVCKSGAPWETTAWARSMADAIHLAEKLRERVFEAMDQFEGPTDACIGVVRRGGAEPGRLRWGVVVRLSRP